MKKLITTIFMLLSCLMLLLQCSGKMKGEPSGGWVGGTVYEAGTQNPIDSVKVVLLSGNYVAFSDTVFTNVEGQYLLFSGFGAGKYFVYANKTGYLESTLETFIIRKDTVSLNFELIKE